MTKIQEQEIRNCRKNVKYDAFLNQSHRPGSSLNETRMSWRWPSASPRIAGTLYPNQSGGYTKWWSSSSALAVPFLYCWKQTCHSERQQLNHHHAARQTRWLKEDVPSAFSCVWAEHHSDTGVTEASWRGPTRCSAEPPALTNSVTYGQPQPPIPWGCCALIRGGGGGLSVGTGRSALQRHKQTSPESFPFTWWFETNALLILPSVDDSLLRSQAI